MDQKEKGKGKCSAKTRGTYCKLAISIICLLTSLVFFFTILFILNVLIIYFLLDGHNHMCINHFNTIYYSAIYLSTLPYLNFVSSSATDIIIEKARRKQHCIF
jgi:hypothetical protein